MKQDSSIAETSVSEARDLMVAFADRTGLTNSAKAPVRYLWTDAFAVCNFFELFRQTGDETFKHLALSLIDQVHAVLGKHRKDDMRQGWISGLNDEDARLHPTAGGLRIGKTLGERPASLPIDNRQEWDRDGQYFHYLTKWMHALNQASRVTGDLSYLRWAVELAKISHGCFTFDPPSGGPKQMRWKMSIDLSRPLVPAMGLHDPLDAVVTYRELSMTATEFGEGCDPLDLQSEIEDAEAMCAGKEWTTDDPLGLGGLLTDAYRLAQMGAATSGRKSDLLESLLLSAHSGLDAFVRGNSLADPVQFRLAFRELGLSIGLHGVAGTKSLFDRDWRCFPDGQQLRGHVENLQQFYPLCGLIETFWRDKHNRQGDNWTAHHDINAVMLATSLIPDGFLSLSVPALGNMAADP